MNNIGFIVMHLVRPVQLGNQRFMVNRHFIIPATELLVQQPGIVPGMFTAEDRGHPDRVNVFRAQGLAGQHAYHRAIHATAGGEHHLVKA